MPRLLIATLCDDVRHEVGAKYSLMGVFTNFNVRNFAQPMPRFHFFAHLGNEANGEVPVSLELRSAEGVTTLRMQGKVLFGGVDAKTGAAGLYEGVLDLTLDNLTLPGPGGYEFVVGLKDTVLATVFFKATHIKPVMQ